MSDVNECVLRNQLYYIYIPKHSKASAHRQIKRMNSTAYSLNKLRHIELNFAQKPRQT